MPAAGLSPYAIYERDPPAGLPSLDLDPFSVEFFDDPFPAHAALREAGPFVWLSRYGIGAVARYEQVRAVLLDWQTFTSERGVGMQDFVHHGRFRLPSLILEADPPVHTRSRAVLNQVLSPSVVKGLRERFRAVAAELVDRLVERRHFDGVVDLARPFPLRVFPEAVGIGEESRARLLPHADLLFNSFGPHNELFHAARERVGPLEWIEDLGRRENLAPDGLGMMVHLAADRGEIPAEDAPRLVRALLQAGLDTTINALGAALYCLARFPAQWARLHEDPTLARAAFEEAIRFESPVQTFFRTATRDTELGGNLVREGDKVLMFLAAANRDPRQWEEPDRYDIARRTIGHVGFGAGIHLCVGQLLARVEGEAVLSELARRARTLSLAGPVERHYNNTVRGLARLPLEVGAA